MTAKIFDMGVTLRAASDRRMLSAFGPSRFTKPSDTAVSAAATGAVARKIVVQSAAVRGKLAPSIALEHPDVRRPAAKGPRSQARLLPRHRQLVDLPRPHPPQHCELDHAAKLRFQRCGRPVRVHFRLYGL